MMDLQLGRNPMKLGEGLSKSSSYCKTNALVDSLKSTGGLHGEEQRVHEQLEGLLPPSPLGVGIPTEAAQQLGTGSKTGHVVGTDTEKIVMNIMKMMIVMNMMILMNMMIMMNIMKMMIMMNMMIMMQVHSMAIYQGVIDL